MQQVIVDFGTFNVLGRALPVRIYGYGLMLVLGFLLGICLARWRAGRFGESADVITNVGLIALVGGIVGARAAFVIERWGSQFAPQPDPLPEILNVTSGGLIYYGGVALAMVLVLTYLKARRLPIRRYLDILAPGLMVGLAFGRLGCLLNGCCFGNVCRADFPFGLRFPYASCPLLTVGKRSNLFGASGISPVYAHQVASGALQPPDWLLRRDESGQVLRGRDGAPVLKEPARLTPREALQARQVRSLAVEPTQALAAGGALLLAGVLVWFSRLRRREGQVFALMVVLYPIMRFLEESLRGDNPHDLLRLQLTHNQYTSLGTVLLGLVLWGAWSHRPAVAGPYWSDRLARQADQSTGPVHRRKGTR